MFTKELSFSSFYPKLVARVFSVESCCERIAKNTSGTGVDRNLFFCVVEAKIKFWILVTLVVDFLHS